MLPIAGLVCSGYRRWLHSWLSVHTEEEVTAPRKPILSEDEIRAAAEEMVNKLFPGYERWVGTSPEYHRRGFIKGCNFALAAAEKREELWRQLLDHLDEQGIDKLDADGSCRMCKELRSALGLEGA